MNGPPNEGVGGDRATDGCQCAPVKLEVQQRRELADLGGVGHDELCSDALDQRARAGAGVRDLDPIGIRPMCSTPAPIITS
jgi:hypothetical protein